jgi:tRNA-dihydrouridine synthase B
VRTARKHIGWALQGLPGGPDARRLINTIEDPLAQRQAVLDFFDDLATRRERLPAIGMAVDAANDERMRQRA